MSEKVRDIIQKEPPFFVRYGTIIMTVIVALLFIIAYCLLGHL